MEQRRQQKKYLSMLLLALLLLTVCLGSGSAAYGAVVSPSASFYVADYAKVVEADTENYIIEKNGELESLCGGQIVVVTVDFLDGMDIEDYAYKLFNDWRIGDEEENNGVLLLLAIGEENYWCMQGKGLESGLSSGDIDDILWAHLEEDFAAGKYDSGVRQTFDALYDGVCAACGVPAGASGSVADADQAGQQGQPFNVFLVILLIVVVLVVVICVVLALRAGRGLFGGPVSRPYGRVGRAPRRMSMRPRPPRTPRTSSSRPHTTFSRPRSSTGGSSSRRTSVSTRSHRPSGHGGGGRSRGGGAGRRH